MKTAFPSDPRITNSLPSDCCGISIRDYFAAKAMQALIGASTGVINYEKICLDAYICAEDMLRERLHAEK